MYESITDNTIINTSNGSIQKITKKVINEIKNELINNGTFGIYRNIIFANNCKHIAETYGTEMFNRYEQFLGANLQLTKFEEKCCRQIYDAQRQRVKRLRDKIKYNLEHYNCLWLTLTFTDSILDNTIEDTRRKYIQRFLKSLNIPFYVANIDYGDKEKNPDSLEREHYHAIIRADIVDMSLYKYGFMYVEKIRNTTKSHLKITQYISKLTNHAYKDSTKGRARLIYSRPVKKEYPAHLDPCWPFEISDMPVDF